MKRYEEQTAQACRPRKEIVISNQTYSQTRPASREKNQSFLTTMLGNLEDMSLAFSATLMAILRAIAL